jgi:EAL domain-containing protein (putative c-di-GMP-specific phosphodiesterase class I)
MLSSTVTHATPRLVLGRAAPAGERRRRLVTTGPAADGLCSPAGLRGRPWLGRLRHALAEDLFVLHFQPIVSLHDGRVSHHEALLRLADEPDGRLVAPGRFLPAAERYGLIREIDRMVLEKVAAVLALDRDDSGPCIAMNLSAVSVSEADMLEHLERRLADHGVEPERLVIELTETAAISDMATAKDFCAGLQALGCGVALDDFGAGFGSFQYLKHLPFSQLKIDGEFIRGLTRSRTDQLVVKALVGVVQGLGRETIAEFVGDRATMWMLREFGVDYAQGYEVGRPQPALALAV